MSEYSAPVFDCRGEGFPNPFAFGRPFQRSDVDAGQDNALVARIPESRAVGVERIGIGERRSPRARAEEHAAERLQKRFGLFFHMVEGA